MIFVTFLWRGHGFTRNTAVYTAAHVGVLASMLKRHGGHQLICVTPTPDWIKVASTITMPTYVFDMPNYAPKLWAFSTALHNIIGEKFAVIDLDCVISDDPLNGIPHNIITDAPFAIWNKAAGEPYNSSLMLIQPGMCNKVWYDFTVEKYELAESKAARWTGDQSWIAHVLGPNMLTFGEEKGIFQYRPKLHRDAHGGVPKNAKVGFMCGPYEPFGERDRSLWVQENYQ